MLRFPILFIFIGLLTLGACDSGPSLPPEEFALQVTQAVAEGDWVAYRPLALAQAQALASDSNPTATQGTFAGLVAEDTDRIRRDFERAVHARVVRTGDLSGYRAVVHATEPDRWHLRVLDHTGKETGLQMTLLRFNDTYRVVHLNAR